MVSLSDYTGREQAYVKHTFLENYLEGLFFKTASIYSHIVYVDGFAGPWQSANEQFEDTSFGIALNTLRRVREAWPNVQMTALLVERDPAAVARLQTVRERYRNIVGIKTYPADFVSVVPDILRDIPKNAFAFYLIDPKGWRIPLAKLRPLLARAPSEVTFNFMFDFINRAANIADPAVINGLDELMPHGDWKGLYEAEPITSVTVPPEERKEILVAAFSESLRQIGDYRYVAETTVLKPLHDRTLYCLFYGTRHHQGLAVFRDAQVKALQAQAHARAAVKVKHAASSSGQAEFFDSLLEMGPNETSALLAEEKRKAEALIGELVPKSPDYVDYRTLWTAVLVQRVVRLPDVNSLCAEMRKRGALVFPDWETGKRVPQDHYRVQRAG
jgi:three-Cys-motif partner protein